METWPGSAYPLGATFDGRGRQLRAVQRMRRSASSCACSTTTASRPGSTWWRSTRSSGTATCPWSSPGSATGTASTASTTRRPAGDANPNKLLLDPYAKAMCGAFDWDPSLFSYEFGDPESYNDEDSAQHTMLGVVINPFFDWTGDRHPSTPYAESVIYEAHVKGLTQRHPEVPPEQRGTYAGIAHPAVIEHLQRLGVTADRADAGAPVRPRPHAGRQGPPQLLGLQHDRLLRPAQRATRRRVSSASRCRSSRRWCARCTRRASR